MDLRSLILNAQKYLETSGCVVAIEFGPEISDEVSIAEMSTTMPESVQQIYRQIGDGLTFSWQSPVWDQLPFGDECESAAIEFPEWRMLVGRAAEYANGWYRYETFEGYNVTDAALAGETAARMLNWTWFHEEPNGDRLCIDLATSEVVYDQHDWFDAGTGANGHVMAVDIVTFLSHWARACFATPTGSYWPDTFIETGIDWRSTFFPRRCAD